MSEILSFLIPSYFILKFLLRPIAEHSFILKVMKKLYMVRTKDKNLVDAPNTYQKIKANSSKTTIKEKYSMDLFQRRLKWKSNAPSKNNTPKKNKQET